MNSETLELYHYGIKGMKWGVRRTRAQLGYPESASKKKKSKGSSSSKKKQVKRLKAARDRERNQNKREEILSSPTKLYRYRNEFTKQEIDDALMRFEWEKRLSNYSIYEINTGKRYADTLLGYIDTGVKAYSVYSKVRNKLK